MHSEIFSLKLRRVFIFLTLLSADWLYIKMKSQDCRRIPTGLPEIHCIKGTPKKVVVRSWNKLYWG